MFQFFLYFILLFCKKMVFSQLVVISESEGPLDDPKLTPSNLQFQQRCEDQLGLESGDISDDDLAVSSAVAEVNYGKEQARLNGDSAWVTRTVSGQWIQVRR